VRGRSHLQKEAAWSRTIFESLFDVLGDGGAKRLRASS
jgi:hypothetical protein